MGRLAVHHRGIAGQSAGMNPQPPAGRPGHGVPAPLLSRIPRRPAIVITAIIACVVVVVALAAAASGSSPPTGGILPSGGSTRAVVVTAGDVRTVEVQGVPGQLTVVGVVGGHVTGHVTLTGQLHWTGHAPAVATRFDRATGVLQLSYRCAAASPCTENYRLAVSRQTAVVLRQPSGHVVVSGLAGALTITAASVDVSATALRCPSLVATITSGHLSATFAAPPRRVAITLTSAQATLRLPSTVAYAVSSQVTSGYVRVDIPHASTATRTVTARIDSGELELLPG